MAFLNSAILMLCPFRNTDHFAPLSGHGWLATRGKGELVGVKSVIGGNCDSFRKNANNKNKTFLFQILIIKTIFQSLTCELTTLLYYKKSILREPPFNNSLNKTLHLNYGCLLIITGIWRIYCVIRQCWAQIPAKCCIRQ